MPFVEIGSINSFISIILQFSYLGLYVYIYVLIYRYIPCIIYMPIYYICIDIIKMQLCTFYSAYLLFLYLTLLCECFMFILNMLECSKSSPGTVYSLIFCTIDNTLLYIFRHLKPSWY